MDSPTNTRQDRDVAGSRIAPAPGEHLVALLRHRADVQPARRIFTFLRDGERDELALTYADLDERARTIAAALAAAGVRAGGRALLMYAPGIDYIAGLFGCLYAGVVAVPAYPPELTRIERSLPRLLSIVADSGATAALTSHDILPFAESMSQRGDSAAPLRWIATDPLDRGMAASWQPPPLDADSLALLQYTSGSTGAPRGVMLSHGNLLHNSQLIRDAFAITRESVGVLWLPPYHDMGLVGGILQPIVSDFPMTLMAPMAFLQRPMRWLEAVSRSRATVSGGPNFAFELCLRKSTPGERAALDLHAWRVAFSGAEPVRHETIARFEAVFGASGFRRDAFYPCYGLAEATLIVSGGVPGTPPRARWLDGEALADGRVVVCEPGATQARSLIGCGRSLGEQQVVIVDPSSGEPCDADRVGEIWAAGRSVARGYWQAAQATAHTFGSQLSGHGGTRYLRTGDLGFLLDGELFVAGRLKDLIIVRGRNLYPQDVEHTVEQAHPSVRPGSGAAIGVEHAGDERLVIVYEVSAAQAADPRGLANVRAAIRAAVVVEHQIAPHAIALVQPGSIAKTSSGKIQRHACRTGFLSGTLSLLDPGPADDGPPVAPSGAHGANGANGAHGASREVPTVAWIIEQVARLTEQAAGEIQATQTLSACGLDSLSAVELQYEIETRFGVRLAPAELLEDLTVQGLEQRLRTGQEVQQTAKIIPVRPSPSVPGAPSHEPLPASFAQERTWFFAQLAPDSPMYNLAGLVRLRGRIDVAALGRAVDYLVSRHASLRTTLPWRDGRLVQEVAAPSPGLLEVVALDPGDAAARLARLDRCVREAAAVPFDLSRRPLFRARLFRIADGDHALLLVAHHAIADGLSLRVFLSELDHAYRALVAGQAPALPALAVQYADFTAWQREQLGDARMAELLGYWRAQLDDLPPALELPTDHPRPAVQRFRGALHPLALPAGLVAQLAAIGREEDATLFMVLLSGFAAWLGHHTGQDEIIIGAPVGNRARPEFQPLIGLFVNTVPLRIDLRDAPTLRQLCRQVRRVCLEAYRHQDLPFEKLVEALQPERRLDRAPICQVMFALQGVPAPFALGELGAEISVVDTGSAQFDLALGLNERDGGLEGALEYDRDLFDAGTVARWAGHLERLLGRAAAKPGRSVGALSCLDGAERDQVLRAWNPPPTAEPEVPLLHRLVEQQAARTPSAIALECGEQRVSYAALVAEATRLARRLRAAGAGPEARVAVCLDRTSALPIALLAVLKAGAAYVPLDPCLPEERQRELLADAAPVLLVTEAGLADACPFAGPRVVIDDGAAAGDDGFDGVPVSLPPEAAAYVIYTSGSTGRPKGVVATHRGVCNHLAWFAATLGLGPADRVLQKYSVSFDASVSELFAPLLAGARVVMAGAGAAADAAALARLMAERDVTVADFVPALLERVLDEPAFARCTGLRHLICGGEVLPVALAARVRACVAATLHNMYGPTEATIGATAWTVGDGDEGSASVPIGRPVANTQVYVVSRALEPVPVGVFGELCIGGLGVTRGYLGRPGGTAERFVPDPFSGQPGARLYRSGDRCRWRADGALEFAGRRDGQIKLRGFRVELGEIESVLRQHPDLQDVLVVAESDEPGALPVAVPEAPPDLIVRRPDGFEVALRITSDRFLQPPRAAQRNWMLRRALDEVADDLVALDQVVRRFVPGSDRTEMSGEWQRSRAAYDPSQLVIEHQQVMQDWETPLMKAMAEIAAASHGEVLEVGFGMGISSTFIQELDVRSHTIIECNADVIERFARWRAGYPGRDIRLAEGRWQDAIDQLGQFDAIFFDTYPVTEAEFVASVIDDVTFAQHFFAAAARHLRPGGIFTYYSNEIDSFSRRHQRLLLAHFSSVELSVVRPLQPPEDCNYWWADSMVAVKAVK